MTDTPRPSGADLVDDSLTDREAKVMSADLKELFGDLLGEQAHLHARMDQFDAGLKMLYTAEVLTMVGLVLLAAAVGLVIREVGIDVRTPS